ncbi:protein EXECUTER 1, chloroplastic [Ananas comosus]|uniref:Protein EXECUTER 1, chloroplastic n=1 Tax=Ananas comosus TaxID=4615 RepID=A0A6P5ESW7_ANACO|nr:protein EXECUTER 1, chloroplastic [Ananas comosus]XP_020084281.1 protein EXECUTER 1, chloroplastic [Ananas comosus]XP_020084282.1 protein EXECUTER 1, chloroplastic [Ananas comosus]XP_020084283.1 protein EXECUTER 1, chloroplastic [Ananas comosus]XP_020084284.1 protein EXECUTER 1, chloroplastic [Ananas comosus]XP_020084285.1 protein EXECUTER 1, chloroplastic [Ananas comosus]
MASVRVLPLPIPSSSSSSSDANPSKVVPYRNPRFLSKPPRPAPLPLLATSRASSSSSRVPDPLVHRCRASPSASSSSSSGDDSERRWRWDSLLQDAVRNAVRRLEEYLSSYWNASAKSGAAAGAGKEGEKGQEGLKKGEEEEGNDAEVEEEEAEKEEDEDGNWSWERWKRHFAEVEESERLVSALKSQLRAATAMEDYEGAEELKLAIIAALRNDSVGGAFSDLSRAVNEERYGDAAYIRDHAGTGLLGWWYGISENAADPYGRIICISAEHGRYVAKSYHSRQLASQSPPFPLFEIYLTVKNGEYKQQAVYLKPISTDSGKFQQTSTEKSDIGSVDSLDSLLEGKSDLFTEERDDDSDLAGLAGLQNVPRDMIPVFKVKVLKVVSSGKVDKDFISKIIDQILEEEDDDDNDDTDLESSDREDIGDENKTEELGTDAREATNATEDQTGATTKLSVSVVKQEDVLRRRIVQVPARLEKRNNLSFSFYIEDDGEQHKTGRKRRVSQNKIAPHSVQHDSELVIPDLAKVIGSKKKVSLKIFKGDRKSSSNKVKEKAHRPLSGAIHFNRIMLPQTSDPLSGLYMGTYGINSEVLHLRRKFGSWQEDEASQKQRDLEFYEYVEAIRLTGDRNIPAGQVVFRAKVGKQNQLPHEGIIPKELGVVARYRGQGRISDPEFKNPHWVDGDLLILDGKFIKEGPVIAFFYWAPNFHLFEFFNRLSLPT